MWPVLKKLPKQNHPDLLIGFNQADDSGVIRINDETAIILTVDFFPAVVDDPYVFGQVAAANALSDVYAMGGRPLSALNIVGFPEEGLPLEVLHETLRGGADKVNEAGAVIAGGHTIKDSELKYGLSVVGVIDPDGILEIGTAAEGDSLVLTKPLGTGIYSTALKKGDLSGDREDFFYGVMSTLNRVASEQMLDHGANACTDVTGFGLIGHALEMAGSSGVTIAIDIDSLPRFPGVLEYAGEGFLTGGGMANREFAKDQVEFRGGVSRELEMLLYDPQTSGGLLVSLPADRAGDYLSAIKERGVENSAIIGEVLPASGKGIIIRA